ncbi:THUMP domain-containing class I SAM-dependent RNA methyltransferase [Citreimonas salinaria]|uniref:Putative N6-adenine-specific DNA methylase n=1 Tax=Citreimonas salinaria TaxID=321339 RepID=A0A1H3M8X2_9RHOB|nr:RNA methyltransferase [Citreimonas salinaria]SDY73187.1 putative N6-adenine-specific DNA methylase [Citreimonas salinaria]
MSQMSLFFTAAPGLEPVLLDEARALGFEGAEAQPGGVAARGDWSEVWRANLWLRGAGHVLVRVAEFRAAHLAQLDKRARKVDWTDILHADVPFRVEATCRRSRIYHDRAARERVERAIAETLGAPHDPEAGLRVMVRIEDDLVTISLDASGEPLHRRGHKEAVGKAPLRETLAASFLRVAGYDGTEPVIDPMCGSGTFVLEAAEIAAGLAPGRTRRFAFEDFASFDAGAWAAMKAQAVSRDTDLRFAGFDRDDGAIRSAAANAARAGVDGLCSFTRQPIAALERPAGAPGLVMVNPPYGARIGNRKLLFALYGTLGQVLRERFRGWRVGLVTSDPGLAKSTELPFLPDPVKVSHGGLTVRLHRTDAL